MFRNREILRFTAVIALLSGILSLICFFISPAAGLASVAALIAPLAAFFVFTKKRYNDIAKLSKDLDRIVNGETGLDVRDNAEGELSILRNEIYKATSRLAEQAELLRKDKANLADSLSNISHQLKTPLTSLLIMSELLENPSLPAAKREEFTANIRIGLFRMEWLVLALLKMAKLDAGAAGMQRESVCIWELADMSARALDVIISGKNQRVIISGDRESALSCDITWTAEALSNIIKNASEHTQEYGEITITWDENPLTARITVRDGGGGIDPADLPHLFKRFYKGSSSRGAERIGIGLALSLEIMRKQNGDIEARNAPGGGAEFVMKFYK